MHVGRKWLVMQEFLGAVESPTYDAVSVSSRGDGTPRGKCRGNVNWEGPLPGAFFLFFMCETLMARP